MLETLTGQDAQKTAIEAANIGSVSLGGFAQWNQNYVDTAWADFVEREATAFALQAMTNDWL